MGRCSSFTKHRISLSGRDSEDTTGIKIIIISKAFPRSASEVEAEGFRDVQGLSEGQGGKWETAAPTTPVVGRPSAAPPLRKLILRTTPLDVSSGPTGTMASSPRSRFSSPSVTLFPVELVFVCSF